MSACSGNPQNCNFCGTTPSACAKDEVAGCTANPASCGVCKDQGCVATECTGNVATCKACSGNYQSCRKAQISAVEGVERVEKAPMA
ncbi:uncharacterized protein MKK02DRAFT_16022 [Dioszegia hungarica]|uniref:Uncharacterized protein n=1 Tax=Dioszegia hungarica TaxID=4972 RepID=A0AA38H8A7_9TREE|nr:uncharacterized protein MKK02DRAFT_16022 [Dioszegia hungarica]KAI9634669.1 hypothetical protein MKK02DRAFT_16022 [Dioszegia hungarica]